MDNIVTVQISDCSCHLSEVERGETFLAVISFADLFEKAAMSGQLQEQIYLGVVAEESIHLEDVRMISEHLYFDLLTHLVLHPCLLHLLFVYHLYSQNESSSQISCHVDITKSALPQSASDLKLSQRKFLTFPRGEHGAEVQEGLVGVLTHRSPRRFITDEQLLLVMRKTLLAPLSLVLLLLCITYLSLVEGLLVPAKCLLEPESLLFHALNWHCRAFVSR
jgi:hypothetical protein